MTAQQRDPLRIGIVGGGMLGLSLAWMLRKRGHAVTLFEASDHIGGLADAWQIGEITWDRHYHVTLLSDSYLRDLLDELQLGDQMRWVETKTGFFTGGRLYSMSNAIEFLQFPPLTLCSKLRLAGTIQWTSRDPNWRRLEKIPVVDYLRRMSGNQTTDKIWLPLLRAKLGENYQLTSAAFIWATINRLYAARRSGLKKEMFGYLSGGYRRLLDAFSRELAHRGVQIQLNTRIEGIDSTSSGLCLNSSQAAETLDRNLSNDDRSDRGVFDRGVFDRVVLTTPSSIVSKICPQLPETERQAHQAVRYQGVICLSLLCRRGLSPFYVTNITDDGFPFTGVIEMTSLIDPEEIQGRHLIYLPWYVPAESDAFELSDDEIRQRFVPGLMRMHPNLSPDDILASRVSRAKYVMPIPTLNYSRTVPPRRTQIDGLSVVNGAQIVNGTLNVNETIKLAAGSIDEIESAAIHPVPFVA